MKLLIVEDEIRIAKLLEKYIKSVWKDQLSSLSICSNLGEANNYLKQRPVDVLFLDLNLNSKNGFDLLKKFATAPFVIVVVSAYSERALEAFEYGVIDFVPKPFTKDRIQYTYNRIIKQFELNSNNSRFISIKKAGSVTPLPVKDILYIKADGHYTELNLKNNKKELSDYSMDRLETLLPVQFIRIHRSYLVSIPQIKELKNYAGSKYELILKDGKTLPVGRSKVQQLKKYLSL